jgi:DNA-binding NtrC family response regulator
LGYTAQFHEDPASLREALSDPSHSQSVLIDLSFEADHAALVEEVAVRSADALVGFQVIEAGASAKVSANAEHYSSNVVLPPHAERAKTRLRTALKSKSSPLGSKAGPSRHNFTKNFKTKAPFAFQSKRLRKEADALKVSPRYLVCRSDAGDKLLQRLRSVGNNGHHVNVLLGEDGTEFELVCREINYQLDREVERLHVLAPEDFCITDLEKIEREAARERLRRHVYVGRSDEFSVDAMHQFSLFADYLANLRNPHLHIYLAHAAGTSQFFPSGVVELFRPLCDRLDPIRLPAMAERAEDIPGICHATIGMLRAAHPFLAVQGISNQAIDYLVETRSELSHQKLIRILRNSAALCQRPVLGETEIKNYGESEMTSQHLLESMADEVFFPAEQTVNF